MRTALLQLNSSDDPAANLPVTQQLIAQASAGGATFVLTPEVTNCVSASRTRQQEVLRTEEDDATLAALRAQAHELGIWLLIGSLALKTDDSDGRFANRSFLIAPDGGIAARYDKIHMFDVEVSETESYREISWLPSRAQKHTRGDAARSDWHDDLLRYPLSASLSRPCAGRSGDSHDTFRILARDRRGALGIAPACACD